MQNYRKRKYDTFDNQIRLNHQEHIYQKANHKFDVMFSRMMELINNLENKIIKIENRLEEIEYNIHYNSHQKTSAKKEEEYFESYIS